MEKFEDEACTREELERLKEKNELGLSWGIIENVKKIMIKTDIIAIIQTQYSEGKFIIDSFEVLRSKQKLGYGRRIISEIEKEVECDIGIMADNEDVVGFWIKCGFEKDYDSIDEIPMTYKRR
ncbi:GNAT family N-acetyltransferase [Blautia coccoides]|uniref:GNAT family N-acetyltransferase n=1 Tax=Blautia producta TaxID=33035 RepID=UPI0028A402D7|nr:GNAT family N-acetyltransferase [Blautia coccoides]MDT4377280.1 GNAT family N-acetyltransferase [Blautia coccoides]